MSRRFVLIMSLIFFLVSMISITGELRLANAIPYLNVNVATAHNMITNGSYPNLVVLDVRTKSEYDEGHIYKAVWIPVAELESRINELGDHEHDEIVVYCKSGGRSATASGILDSYNFTTVYNMLGGITAWQSAGYPVWIATVHNLNTSINYDIIQAAINAPQTLEGHTIFVESSVYYEHIVINKSLTLIGEDREETVIDGNGNGTAVLVERWNITLTRFTVSNAFDGIILFSAAKNTTISDNIISGNTNYGIGTTGPFYGPTPPDNYLVKDNIVKNNKIGICLKGCFNNTICYNDVRNNSDYGIQLTSSDPQPPSIKGSHQNVIAGNDLVENGVGLNLLGSDNRFYHNNFLNNINQVEVYYRSDYKNSWSNDYLREGNYWSNYNGTDSDSNGIGDTPYIIDEDNQDNYPLMEPHTSLLGDMNQDYKIDMRDIAIAASAIGTYPTHPRWIIEVDVNQDSIVDMQDLILIASNFGKTYL